MIKLVIFDFDGTIVNSKKVYYEIIGRYASKLGFSMKEVDSYIDKGKSIDETLKEMGFSWFKRQIMKIKIAIEVIKNSKRIRKCKDVDSIRDLGERKVLISNSLSSFIKPILRNLRLEKYFSEIYGSEHFRNKAEFIKNYLKKNKIKKENCYYIGDRAADVKVARKAGCKSIIVSGKCSWDSRKEILKEKPDFIVDSIKEIKEVI